MHGHSCRFIALFLGALLIGLPVQSLAQASDANVITPLLFAESTRLENGIRLIHLPSNRTKKKDGLVDVLIGYTAGLRDEKGYKQGVFSTLETYLSVSPATRSLALAVHFAGGQIDFLRERDLIGMRLRVPVYASEEILKATESYFSQRIDLSTVEFARDVLSETLGKLGDYRTHIYDDIRHELLGNHPYGRRQANLRNEIDRVATEEIERYYNDVFGTDKAFVITSQPSSEAVHRVLSEIRRRPSKYPPNSIASRTRQGSSIMKFPSRPVGGVILATVTESVHFQAWFATLVLSGLIRDVVPPQAAVEFGPSIEPFLHQIILPVKIPGYAEEDRDTLIKEIDALQYRPVSWNRLMGLKEQALRTLTKRETLEWFAAQDLWEVLEVGLKTVKNMTSDSLRSIAQDFVSARNVQATWSPAFVEPSSEVEMLNEDSEPEKSSKRRINRASISVDPLAAGKPRLPFSEPIKVELLPSGITLAVAEDYAVFVEGSFPHDLPNGISQFGSNGVLWLFDKAPTTDAFEVLRRVRADRILVFAPKADIASIHQYFEDWESGSTDFVPTIPMGQVATGDIPSLLVLKAWLEGKLIEAGWWQWVKLRIDGLEGARLLIEGDPQLKIQVRSWIHEVAKHGLTERELLFSKIAATSYHERIRGDLQILLWQRDPLGLIRSPVNVLESRLRKVARIYFP